MLIAADTFGSNYDTVLSAWTGTQGALSRVACNDDFGGLQSQVTFDATAGTTYYFMVAICCGNGESGGADLVFHVHEIAPPPNDDFANATQVTSIPFADDLDLTEATVEPGEPSPSCGSTPIGTAWYSFTPSVTQSYFGALTSNSGLGFVPEFGIFTGSSLGTLREVACHFGNPIGFHATAGTTYYIQVANGGGGGNPARFTLTVAPQPQAAFSFYPPDPSVFDTIQFYDQSFDPAQIGIQSEAWSFGDGATGTGCCPTHRYAADGAYTVTLTVQTFDGRTASTSQTVSVKTHDVAIKKFTVPQSASVGQTRQIVVGVGDLRYPEMVQVQLLKSTTSSCCTFQQIGTLTQSVPVRSANRTTSFSFNYTFTSDDAAAGKVTFEAIATILSARDAIPGDNTVIALPTKVSR